MERIRDHPSESGKPGPKVLCDRGTIAAASGDAKGLEEAIDAGLDVNCTSSYRLAPLHAAASSGNLEILRMLMAKGANPAQLSEETSPRTPIMVAAHYQRLNVIDELVQWDPDPCRSSAKFSILSLAVMSGSEETFLHVLPLCISREDRNYHLGQALFVAASRGYRQIALDIMNEIPQRDELAKFGASAIFMAVIKDRREVLDLLIDHGVPVSARDSEGKTLLMAAAAVDGAEMIVSLLRHGADPNLRDNAGMSALSYAAALGAKEALEAILAAGVDVDAHAEPCGNTALHYATALGRAKVVRALVAHGASSHIVNCDGYDSLSIAKQKGLSEIQRILEADGN